MSYVVQVLIRAEEAPGKAIWRTYDGEDRIEVRELGIRAYLSLRAREISPYRHALRLDGKTYHVLNVVRKC